jgi:hypothetical protein
MARPFPARVRLVVAAAILGLTGCAGFPAADPVASSAPAGSTSATAAATSNEPAATEAAPQPSTAEPVGDAATGSAEAALARLPVKGRAPRTGYDRELFGSGWGDPDRNGCDARNDVLARDLSGETFKPGTRDCVVAAGTLADPYSGRAIAFVRGQDTSDDVQIDHVVAVSDAWQKGAQGWTAQKRVAFYNDPLNLLAVDGPLNLQKGDGDAATWLPPNRSYRCAYVARQVAVKAGYGVWVTEAERTAMAGVLERCPGQELPEDDGSGMRPATVLTSATTSASSPSAVPGGGGGPYANCSEARAAGDTPVRRGQAGYGTHLDGDGDGVGCE